MFNVQAFDRKQFETFFARSLGKLIDSEKITRETLRDLSRSVLEAHHMTEDVAFINRLIDVLTPVNKKVAIAYFQHFGGFHFDGEKGAFTKKNKAIYAERRAEAEKFLDDPLNNLWVWADRHIDIAPKVFDAEAIKKWTQGALKKAEKNGLSQIEVFKAIIEGGLTVETIIATMEQMGYEEQIVEETPMQKVGEALV